jgi:DNA-binding transcriptional ArsR family regulator
VTDDKYERECRPTSQGPNGFAIANRGRSNPDDGVGAMNDDRQTIDPKLIKALAHPTRVRILEALQGRTASPVELAKEIRETLANVGYHANVLLEVDCIEQVRTRPQRGATEHFYTARPRSFIGHQDWRRAPLSVRAGVTDEAVRTFVERIGAAIDADTIDSREDTTLNWMPITVDEQGWRETAEILDRALRELQTVAATSRARLGGEAGIPVVTGLAAFETPPGGGSTDGLNGRDPTSSPIRGEGDQRPPWTGSHKGVEAAVLAALVDASPDGLMESVLRQDLTSIEHTPERQVAIGKAIEGLIEVGLVVRAADHLDLTPPALRAAELDLGL